MSISNGLLQLLVRCPRCDGRNAVDLRKQGLARRARCGRCGEPLPRRLPAPLLLLIVASLVITAGLVHFGVDAMRARQATHRRADVARLLDEGRPADAVRLLPSPRSSSSEDGQLARRVAQALAAPVLAAAADPGSGRATVEAAVDLGDGLLEEYEKSLPELLVIVDQPLRRLIARLVAFDLVEPAREIGVSDAPDLPKLERALEAAAVRALDSPPDVAAAVEDLSHGIRARAVLVRARALVARKPDAALQLLQATAQRLPPPVASGVLRPADRQADSSPAGTLLAQKTVIQSAIESRDMEALARSVQASPESEWSDAEREDLDRDVRHACLALASLGAEQAAAESDPTRRASLLLTSMTCDEILPKEFLAEGRVALAESLLEAARRGGAFGDALLALDDVAVAQRNAGLVSLACAAEERGAHAAAVLAWSRVTSAQALQRMARCADEPPAARGPVTVPALDYPSLGS